MLTLRQGLNPKDQALLNRLAAVNGQLATLYFQGQGELTLEQYQALVTKLERQRQALEAKISARSAKFRVQAQPVTLKQVQNAIPAGAALVELAAYRPFYPRYAGWRGESRYAAYVLHPEGDLAWVDLGKAELIDQTVENLRSGLADPDSNVPYYVGRFARELDEQVMRPIRKRLGDTPMVLLSPDGTLNLVPFGASMDEHNRYLVERYTFTYLTSGRDLLQLQVKSRGQQQGVIIANPNYDLGDKPQPIRTAQAERGNDDRRSSDFLSAPFKPLPGTAGEARAIGEILDDAQVFTGARATESALKQVNEPSVLHIATHGFFLEDQPQPLPDPNLALTEEVMPPAPTYENPLLRSGLALAGANDLESGTEDGVLTALEAANLDLWGTKLVALSACETGVGEVESGEGVYGLRRALVIAGSESQVMSLWNVADQATKDLMVKYYRRLMSGQGRSEGLRQVQLDMLNSEDRSHPYYWASFIPSGEWTSLDHEQTVAQRAH
jgi:CHAT domain-containing protein